MPEDNNAPNPIPLSSLYLRFGKRYELAWDDDAGWGATESSGTPGARPVVKISTPFDNTDANWTGLIGGLSVAALPLTL